MSPYGMPNVKAITSASGNIAHTAVHVQKRAGGRWPHHRAAAPATRAWLTMVGIKRSARERVRSVRGESASVQGGSAWVRGESASVRGECASVQGGSAW